MKLYKIVSLITLSALLFVLGCSDRGVNSDKDSYKLSEGSYFTKQGAHVFHDELVFQIKNKFQQMPLSGYWPKAAFPIEAGGEFKPVPLLVLLAPQDGDENFYFSHGLKEIADELISKGEIQPMAILCVPNDKIYGGYFYAGSAPAAGLYDSLIGDELIRFAEEEFFVTTIRDKAHRAIGGFGMGAYGAYRAAMLHPDKFGAVSGVAGPMDFDGADGNSGFKPLFVEALAEQGITGQNLQDNFLQLDDKTLFGPWHLSRLFVGGGFAFSAVDTLITYTDSIKTDPSTGLEKLEYYLVSDFTLDTTVFPSSSRISFPGYAVPPNAFKFNSDFTYSFYLPFDNVGDVVDTVWSLWLNNNLPTLFAANPNVFDGVNLWIGNSSESTFGNYYEQTNSWVSTLRNSGVPISITEFDISGYDGHPAINDQYVYDYLREMLIFHSENFGN